MGTTIEQLLPGKSESVLTRSGLQLLLLTAAATAALYARTAISPLQEAMRVALTLTDNEMALLQGPALALPVVAATLPLGMLIDRYCRVRLLVIFNVFALLGSVWTAAASNFTTLFLARCLVGLAAPATWIAASSLIGDLYDPTQRGRATMVVAVGQFAGMSAAFGLGGVLIAKFGAGSAAWRQVMLWLVAPLVLVTVALLAMREPGRTGVSVHNPAVRDAVAQMWRYRRVITPLFVGIVMLEIALGAVFTWTAPALARHFGLKPDRIGAAMATALAVSGVLGPIVGGLLADYGQRTGGPRRTISALALLVALGAPTGLFAVAPTVGPAVLLAITFMTMVSAILVTGTALFTIVVPNEVRGLCMAALTGTSVLCGLGLSPLTVSLLSVAIGGPAMIGAALALICVLCSVMGAVSFAFGRQCLPQTP